MNYFLNPAISNSSFNLIDPETGGAPSLFYDYLNGKVEDEKTPSLEKGDYLHKYILTPEEFPILTCEMPPPAIQEVVKRVFYQLSLKKSAEEQKLFVLSDHSDIIMQIADETEYQRNWKPETRKQKIIELGAPYFDALKEAGDRTILSGDVLELLKRCADSIRRNSAANALLLDSPGQIVFNEQEIYWTEEWNGMNLSFKAKLDRLVVDPKEKTFSIVDFKTTSKYIVNFPSSFDFYHYYRQISFYEHAAKIWLEQQGYQNFTPDDHYIVAVETKGANLCRTYVVSEPYLRKGRKETADLLNRIVFHFSTGDWINAKEEQETVNKTYMLIPEEFN